MASYASSLLDELMGRYRDANPDDKPKEPHWSDPEVCKMFLCGFCPNELFINTRADLGMCNKIHDDELSKKYMASSRCMRMGYEEEFLTCLQSLIGEVERKIRRGHARLALNQAHSNSAGPIGIHQEKLQLLSDRISDLIEQAEKLGCEGRIEEAQGVLKLCDQLKEERTALQESASNQMTSKEMEVCPICGAFLVVGDVPQRVEEHVSGKQHMGYAKVRDTIDRLKKKMRGEDPDKDAEREARLKREREERDKEKEKERRERELITQRRDERRDVEERSATHRSQSHSHRHCKRSRSRSRSHDRHHHRSRSKDRHRKHSKERRRRTPNECDDNGSLSNNSR